MIAYPNQGQLKPAQGGYDEECWCAGRNGFSYCAGIEICDFGNRIRIYPLTRRNLNRKANTLIEIPRNADVIDMICAELQAMKRPVRASDPSLDEEG